MPANNCFWACHRLDNIKVQYSGFRDTFYYPGGGTYKGCWLNKEHHGYGVKTTKNGLIYDGVWKNGKRHGIGSMLKKTGTEIHRIYCGQWKDDKKSGEGAQFYDDGIYYGYWQNNRRHGRGMMWYNDGRLYIGEWQADVYHGLGVIFYVNGNRYEGCFARGYKNGEGIFYHMHIGQIQTGMWENDVCKTSIFQDEFRNQVERPTEYPLPRICLKHPDHFMRKLFAKHEDNEYKEPRSFKELNCLNYVRKVREFLFNKGIHKIKTLEIDFPCVCKKREEFIQLRER